MRWLYKNLMVLVGFITLIIGLIFIPLPIPIGVPLTALGIVLLLKSSSLAKRSYIRLRAFTHCHMRRLEGWLLTLEKFWRQRKPPKNHPPPD